MKHLTQIISVMSAIALLATIPIGASAKSKLTLEAENKNNGIKLSWNKPAPTKKFTLLRKAAGKKKFKTIKKLNGKFTFTDKTAKAGKKYIYKIVNVKTKAKTSIIRLETPTITKFVSEGQGLRLSWEKIKGAEKYEIYSAPSTGEYKIITTVKTNSLSKYFSKAEQEYKYKVRAVSGKSKSAFSKAKKLSKILEIGNSLATHSDIPEDAVSVEYTQKIQLGWVKPEYCISEMNYPDVTTIFNSFDEYKNYFEKTFDEYDEEFFETKSLIFLYRYEVNYSTKHRVGKVAVKDNVLYVQDVEGNPKDLWVEPALANWNIFVAVNKSDIKNTKKLCVSYEYELYDAYEQF